MLHAFKMQTCATVALVSAIIALSLATSEKNTTTSEKADTKKSINVSYILQYIASGVQRQWPIEFDGFARWKRNTNETSSYISVNRAKRPLKEKPLVIAGGPGWAEVQLPPPAMSDPRAHALTYRARSAPNASAAAPVEFARAWGEHALVTPLTPCPGWLSRGLFCLVVSDGIDVGQRLFLDYEGELTSRGFDYVQDNDGKASCVGQTDGDTEVSCNPVTAQQTNNNAAGLKAVEVNVTYKFVFRIWNCDPTIESFDCIDIGRESDAVSLPPVKQLVDVPIVNMKMPIEWVRTMRRMWPLFLVLLIILLGVGLPAVFIKAKRIGEREALRALFTAEQRGEASSECSSKKRQTQQKEPRSVTAWMRTYRQWKDSSQESAGSDGHRLEPPTKRTHVL